MKILVTGGCGFIGQSLCKRLILEGYEVDIIDNLYIGKEAKIIEGCNFLGGDVRAMENISDKSYDWIYHLAAFSRVGISYEHKNLTFSVNVNGTKGVLDYALKNNCKVIFASSSSIHHSISPYASSKIIGEELCKFYRNGLGLDITTVRLYNVYGPGELVESHMAALFGKWRRLIKNNESLSLHHFGVQKRAFTHIDDVIDGLIKLLNTNEINHNGWEMGNTKTYSVYEIYKMFEKKFPNLKIENESILGGWSLGDRKNNEVERLEWYPKDRVQEYIDSL